MDTPKYRYLGPFGSLPHLIPNPDPPEGLQTRYPGISMDLRIWDLEISGIWRSPDLRSPDLRSPESTYPDNHFLEIMILDLIHLISREHDNHVYAIIAYL